MESDNNTPTPPTIEPNPKLAGINVFSPAPSQPPSPTLSRRDLSESLRMTSVRPKQESGEGGGGGVGERDRARSGSFSSGESSYAVLEKDSEGEDGSGVYMRRRQPGVSDSISDS